jgi:hypothetical protein
VPSFFAFEPKDYALLLIYFYKLIKILILVIYRGALTARVRAQYSLSLRLPQLVTSRDADVC